MLLSNKKYRSAVFLYKMLFSLLFVFGILGCKKLVKIDEPINSITTTEVFKNDATATSAISGIYSHLFSTGSTRTVAMYTGTSADELNPYAGNDFLAFQFNNISLVSTNSFVNKPMWSPAYYEIYMANADIEGLQKSSGVSDLMKGRFIGESKFLRALCYFNLVNLFGDIPLLTTTSWVNNSLAVREPVSKCYQQIIADLKDAEQLLPNDYSSYNNERIRATMGAAEALLARVYLYTGDFQNAEIKATTVITNPLYNLTPNLVNVFKANSIEAILQLQPPLNISPYTTYEGNFFIPTANNRTPNYYLTNQLLNAFEAGDQRRINWVATTTPVISGVATKFYYPYKYQVRLGTANVLPAEYYMVLRLAEQYLIRAEARAQLNKLPDAIADLNVIRARANLPALSASLTQTQVLAAVAQERRIELFAEWGHRWFDLKRTGTADAVLSSMKTQWQPWNKVYPIPLSELQRDPNLVQNPGYQ
jgi:hypothetical protein